jgi:F420-dependent oxidoreductase-like protein
MADLSFGIKTAPQHTTYEAMQEIWRAADATPVFEHAWLFDHFNPIHSDVSGPCLEGWTLLAAMAAQTRRIRIGQMVTGNTYRHPAVLAHMAATVDIISGGRLDLGIGAGWNEYEHASMGIPLYAPGERIRRLGEACEIARRLFTEPTVDFDGRYYQLKEARLEPKPLQRPYPPFVIGGGGEQLTLRVVARYADVWNFAGGPVETFQRKIAILHQHCAEVGRDPASIQLSVQVPVSYDDLPATVQAVQGYVDAGATHLILNLRYPYPANIVQQLADEVVPQVRPPGETR